MKRARDVLDSSISTGPFSTGLVSPPSSPDLKRRRHQSSPIRPAPAFSTPGPSPFTGLHTPYSVPQDSPNNPFGLKRSLIALDLPRPTKFSKHVAVRLQLVLDHKILLDGATKRQSRGGVYRIVQVPLNYTVRHVHMLIMFLFASDLELNRYLTSATNSVRRIKAAMKGREVAKSKVHIDFKKSASSRSAGKGKAKALTRADTGVIADRWGGHYFEVMQGITVEREAVRPGAIKPGAKVWAKLSSVRERRLFRDLYYDGSGDDGEDEGSDSRSSLRSPTSPSFLSLSKPVDSHNVDHDANPDLLDEDEPSDPSEGEWHWEGEDDFTMGKVWPKGPDLTRGFVYHHAPGVSIHATINTLPIESRRGAGNTPYVFLAQGEAGVSVQRANLKDRGDLKRIHRSKLSAKSEDGDEQHELDTDADSSAIQKQIVRWNAPGAFERFIKAEAEAVLASFRPRRSPSPSPTHSHSQMFSSSPPRLVYDRSSSLSVGVDPSSDAELGGADSEHGHEYEDGPSHSTTYEYSTAHESSFDTDVDVARFSDSVLPYADAYTCFPTVTPFPAHPLKRRRVEYAERRMEKLTRSGLREVMSEDEGAEKKERGRSGKKGTNNGDKSGKPREVEGVEEDADGEADAEGEDIDVDVEVIEIEKRNEISAKSCMRRGRVEPAGTASIARSSIFSSTVAIRSRPTARPTNRGVHKSCTPPLAIHEWGHGKPLPPGVEINKEGRVIDLYGVLEASV